MGTDRKKSMYLCDCSKTQIEEKRDLDGRNIDARFGSM